MHSSLEIKYPGRPHHYQFLNYVVLVPSECDLSPITDGELFSLLALTFCNFYCIFLFSGNDNIPNFASLNYQHDI